MSGKVNVCVCLFSECERVFSVSMSVLVCVFSDCMRVLVLV